MTTDGPQTAPDSASAPTSSPTTSAPGSTLTYVRLTPDQQAARKRRNVYIALALVAFMVLLFTTTFLRMLHNQKAGREAQAAAEASAPLATDMNMARDPAVTSGVGR